MRLFSRLIGTAILLSLPAAALAAEQSFSDLPANNPHFTSAEYLKTHNILEGYADGTFRADQAVNRAEVMKIIVGNVLPNLSAATGATSSFRDITPDAWFLPYVEAAYKDLRIIDGPPVANNFAPQRTVMRAEFLKMLLLAYNVDPVSSYSEITFPLSVDATDSGDWYYPYLRYAITASMIGSTNDTLEPGAPLTRGDIADMLYRFLLYREGKRTQTLLSVTENETLTALRMIDSNALDTAEHSAARAILAARGALVSQPNDNTVKSAVKTAEAAMALVHAAQSLAAGDAPKARDDASTAWHLGEKAKSFSSALNALVNQIQGAAAALADKAR